MSATLTLRDETASGDLAGTRLQSLDEHIRRELGTEVSFVRLVPLVRG